MLAQIKAVADFDWAGAEAEFKRALELGPSSADTYDLYGRMCATLGRFDEAIAMGERAHELDPLAHRSDLATTLLRAGRNKEALETAIKGVEFDPHYDRGHATLGWALFLNGRQDEGIAALQRAAAMSGSGSSWLSQLGQAYGMAGRMEEARGILAQLLANCRRALRAAVSPGLHLRGAGRVRHGDGHAGAGVRAALGSDLRHQGFVPVRAASYSPAIHRVAEKDESAMNPLRARIV